MPRSPNLTLTDADLSRLEEVQQAVRRAQQTVGHADLGDKLQEALRDELESLITERWPAFWKHICDAYLAHAEDTALHPDPTPFKGRIGIAVQVIPMGKEWLVEVGSSHGIRRKFVRPAREVQLELPMPRAKSEAK